MESGAGDGPAPDRASPIPRERTGGGGSAPVPSVARLPHRLDAPAGRERQRIPPAAAPAPPAGQPGGPIPPVGPGRLSTNSRSPRPSSPVTAGPPGTSPPTWRNSKCEIENPRTAQSSSHRGTAAVETEGPGQRASRVIDQVGTRNGTGLPDLQDPRDLPSPAGDGGLEYRAQPSRSGDPHQDPRASRHPASQTRPESQKPSADKPDPEQLDPRGPT